MPRDQRPQLIERTLRARSTVARTEKAFRLANAAYRLSLKRANEAGVSKAALAKLHRTSEGRIRQQITQAAVENER